MKTTIAILVALLMLLARFTVEASQSSPVHAQALDCACDSPRQYASFSELEGTLPVTVPMNKVLMITGVVIGPVIGTRIAVRETPLQGQQRTVVEAMATESDGFQTVPPGVFVRPGATVTLVVAGFNAPLPSETAIHGFFVDTVAMVGGERREYYVTGNGLFNDGALVPSGKKLVITALGTWNVSHGLEFRAIQNGGPIWGYAHADADGVSLEETLLVLDAGQGLQYGAFGSLAVVYGYLVDS